MHIATHQRSEAPSAESWKKRRLSRLLGRDMSSHAPRTIGSNTGLRPAQHRRDFSLEQIKLCSVRFRLC